MIRYVTLLVLLSCLSSASALDISFLKLDPNTTIKEFESALKKQVAVDVKTGWTYPDHSAGSFYFELEKHNVILRFTAHESGMITGLEWVSGDVKKVTAADVKKVFGKGGFPKKSFEFKENKGKLSLIKWKVTKEANIKKGEDLRANEIKALAETYAKNDTAEQKVFRATLKEKTAVELYALMKKDIIGDMNGLYQGIFERSMENFKKDNYSMAAAMFKLIIQGSKNPGGKFEVIAEEIILRINFKR